ncbi:MAG TPA: erythromycin esterase family protein [Thermoanaerobaculia bacterium]|jgi:erythromycin esterase
MRKLAVAVLLAMVIAMPALAQRRRAATPLPVDATTVAGWLSLHARPLVSVEPYPWSYDLEPLGRMVGDATIVGLGDGTHGTHEFFTVKQRIIEYLAREKQFDVIALEAPFSIFNRLNDWVQGGAGDPVAILAEGEKIGYYFWYTEEILELVRAMREYNLRRGSQPRLEIAGVDIYGYQSDAAAVVAYLRGIDPAAAVRAESLYSCIGKQTTTCEGDVTRVHDQLAARRAELVPLTSARAFDDAVRAARIVLQYFEGAAGTARDASMAANTLWLQKHHSASGKVMVWAHNEHLGRTKTANARHPMGLQITTALADPNDYFIIGTLAGGGSFLQYTHASANAPSQLSTQSFRAFAGDSYEARFSEARVPQLLVPLDGELPAWLTTATSFRWAGSGPQDGTPDVVQKESLPEKFDAVVFVATTTPARMLPR